MMKHRTGVERPDYIYPAEPWRFVEKGFYPEFLGQAETLFSTGNGYLGIRGCFEENAPVHHAGTFINGFYESWPIQYPEEAFGFAKTGQTIVDVTDARIIRLFIDGEPLDLAEVEIESYERALDMRNGVLERELVWTTPSGKRARLRSKRLVSFVDRHLAVIEYEVTMLDAAAPLDIRSVTAVPTGYSQTGDDPRKSRALGEGVLRPVSHTGHELRAVLCHETGRSGLRLACGVDHQFETECPYTLESRCFENEASVTFSVDASPGAPVRLVKYVTYHHDDGPEMGELRHRARRTLDRAIRRGAADIRAEQRTYLDAFWADSDYEVGDDAVQQAIRFNLFHILQASARADGAGVAAKGLTGHGYEGHYFWDTEIYVLPFLIYTQPQLARNLLMFRYRTLDKARQRAREVNQRGALFPWRTISGEEASAYYAAGTAQYHINADIVYAIRKYVNATGDTDFLYGPGAEILVETARLWLDLGFFSGQRSGKFCIVGVTGPDEYNTVVNNNIFTNLMARENLRYAVSTVEHLAEQQPAAYAALVDATGLVEGEPRDWRQAAENMYLPYSEELGIYLQDDDFLERKPWDFGNTPAEKFPLLLNYHPLVIYRHQVIKQADVVLAMFLLRDQFDADEIKRTYDFYDPMTTGDSSLSVCIQGIVAAELRYMEKARQYARHALLMDLNDVAGNVSDGCHIASMGGTWIMLAQGLVGFRDAGGEFSFRPLRPRDFHDVRMRFRIRGNQLEVCIRDGETTYRLLSGPGLDFCHVDEPLSLTPENPTAVRACLRTA